MIVQLTAAGQALLEGNTGPVTVTSFQLGSAYGYIPEASDTGIHGTLIYSGVPSSPLAVSANLVLYSSYLDYDLGPFEFGEIGLFVGTTLFALAAGSAPISKIEPGPGSFGNSIRIDEYVSVVGTNYQMWLNLAESSNAFQMAVITSPDLLPQSSRAIPNAYVISGVVNSQSAFLAYTDKLGLWNFDAYQYGMQVDANVVSSDSQSVTIALGQFVSEMQPQYFGQVILEFTSGALYSVCRYVQTAIISGNFVTLGFDSPIAMQPAAGDSFAIFIRLTDSEVPQFPPATTTSLGGIIVGQYLTVQPNGLLSVNASTLPYPVTSVDGQTGAVVVQATNNNAASGLSLISNSGATTGNIKLKTLVGGTNITVTADANGNVLISDTYTLPVASLTTLGGVKAPSDGNLTISATGVIDLGFTPVTSVDGMTGAVVLPLATTTAPGLMQVGSGLSVANGVVSWNPDVAVVTSVDGQTGAVTVKAVDNDPVSGFTLIADSGATTGIIKLNTIVHGLAILVGSDAYGNVQISSPYATTTTPGSIIVGSGLTISSGVLSTTLTGLVTSVDGQSGAVVVEAVDNSTASGVTLITDSGATTGQIKLKTLVAGTGVTLTNDINGNLKVTSTATGNVVSVNGQVGAVVVQATDANAASGTSLIVNSGATTGNITLKTIVAGSNITLGTDANGNLQINGSASPYTLPAATTTTLGGIIVGSGLSVTAGGVLSATGGSVASFNTRTGAVTFQLSDLTGVGGATLSDVAAAKYYDLMGGGSGSITASQLLLQHPAARTITIPANMAGSQAYAATAPTAVSTLTVSIVGGSAIGTIVFAAGSHTATFTTTGGAIQTITPGQVVDVTGPATADATLATVSFTILTLAT